MARLCQPQPASAVHLVEAAAADLTRSSLYFSLHLMVVARALLALWRVCVCMCMSSVCQPSSRPGSTESTGGGSGSSLLQACASPEIMLDQTNLRLARHDKLCALKYRDSKRRRQQRLESDSIVSGAAESTDCALVVTTAALSTSTKTTVKQSVSQSVSVSLRIKEPSDPFASNR